MIFRNRDGKIEIKGYSSKLSQVFEVIGSKQEVVSDILNNKLKLRAEETGLTELLKVALEESTQVINDDAKEYFKYKEREKIINNNDLILQKLAGFENQLKQMLNIVVAIADSNLNTQKTLEAPEWIDLKEIVKAFKTTEGQIYTIGTIRNKIKKEVRAGETYGHLKIRLIGLHLVLIKKGKKWLARRKDWETEKQLTFDYDLMNKLKNKARKYKK